MLVCCASSASIHFAVALPVVPGNTVDVKEGGNGDVVVTAFVIPCIVTESDDHTPPTGRSISTSVPAGADTLTVPAGKTVTALTGCGGAGEVTPALVAAAFE
jgi:hypothetical protein